MHRTTLWLLPLAWFMSSMVFPTETRYIDADVPVKNETEEDDTDLEQVLSDYYDNLMEIWGLNSRTENDEEMEEEEEEDEERVKPRRHDGRDRMNSLSDMKELSKNFTAKDYYDLATPIQIGNVTYRLLNESYAALLDLHRANRERIKNIRLTSIKDSLLNLRGSNATVNMLYPNPQQTKTMKELFEKRLKETTDWSTSNMYAEKRQSFYPSCDIPRNTDEDIWSDQNAMNLFFDVYFPTPRSDSALMIVNAILRLHTKSQGTPLFPVNITAPDLMVQMDQTLVQIPNYSLLNADDDERIRISVYWYTKSLRRRRIVKKLLDSQMMPLYGSHVLTFDIRAAVRSWKESGKNFGLAVMVEDENSNPLVPNKYIHAMNCSKWAASVKPLPLFDIDSPTQYFIEDHARFGNSNGTVNETSNDEEGSNAANQPLTYPLLGLWMREITQTEIQSLSNIKSVQKKLESRFMNATRRHSHSSGKHGSSPTSRITDFENVCLGSPITKNQNSTSQEYEAKSNTSSKI